MKEVIQLTPSAVNEIKRLFEREGKPNQGLRVGVEESGCSGFSYQLSFDYAREGDHAQEAESVQIFVDPKSEVYVSGLTLDFVDGLHNRGFKFLNPNAKKTCGCGESFSV